MRGPARPIRPLRPATVRVAPRRTPLNLAVGSVIGRAAFVKVRRPNAAVRADTGHYMTRLHTRQKRPPELPFKDQPMRPEHSFPVAHSAVPTPTQRKRPKYVFFRR